MSRAVVSPDATLERGGRSWASGAVVPFVVVGRPCHSALGLVVGTTRLSVFVDLEVVPDRILTAQRRVGSSAPEVLAALTLRLVTQSTTVDAASR